MVIDPQIAFINSRVLLIDIGGTNIRTASADIGSSSLINPNKQNLDCLASFDEMLQGFLDEDASIKHLVFSMAGPKLHHSIAMTNREFKIDEAEVLKKFKVDSCHILNDWESIGHGLSLFKTQSGSSADGKCLKIKNNHIYLDFSKRRYACHKLSTWFSVSVYLIAICSIIAFRVPRIGRTGSEKTLFSRSGFL